MLTYEQLRHFADHDWILEEDVLNRSQIDAYKSSLERQDEYVRPVTHTDDDDIININCMVN